MPMHVISQIRVRSDFNFSSCGNKSVVEYKQESADCSGCLDRIQPDNFKKMRNAAEKPEYQ
jgi:hypothetical protein